MRHESLGNRQLDRPKGLRAWVLRRLKPVVSPVDWLVRRAPDGVYMVETNRGFGWRPEVGFATLNEALAHGRMLHGNRLPTFLQAPAELSCKG